MTQHALCDHCATLKRLTAAGTVVMHYLKVPIGVRHTERVRKVRQACPGSGRPPRPPQGGSHGVQDAL